MVHLLFYEINCDVICHFYIKTMEFSLLKIIFTSPNLKKSILAINYIINISDLF